MPAETEAGPLLVTDRTALAAFTVTFLVKFGAVAVLVALAAVPVTVLVPVDDVICAPVYVTVPVAPMAIAGIAPSVPVDVNAVPPSAVGVAPRVCEALEWLTTDITGLIVELAVADPAGGVIPVISSEYRLRVFVPVAVLLGPWLPIV